MSWFIELKPQNGLWPLNCVVWLYLFWTTCSWLGRYKMLSSPLYLSHLSSLYQSDRVWLLWQDLQRLQAMKGPQISNSKIRVRFDTFCTWTFYPQTLFIYTFSSSMVTLSPWLKNFFKPPRSLTTYICVSLKSMQSDQASFDVLCIDPEKEITNKYKPHFWTHLCSKSVE